MAAKLLLAMVGPAPDGYILGSHFLSSAFIFRRPTGLFLNIRCQRLDEWLTAHAELGLKVHGAAK